MEPCRDPSCTCTCMLRGSDGTEMKKKNSYNYDDVESVTIHNDWFVLFFHDYNSFDIIRDVMPLEKRVIGY